MIVCKCPGCGKDIRTSDANAGKKARCPECKTIWVLSPVTTEMPVPAVEQTPTGQAGGPGRATVKRLAFAGVAVVAIGLVAILAVLYWPKAGGSTDGSASTAGKPDNGPSAAAAPVPEIVRELVPASKEMLIAKTTLMGLLSSRAFISGDWKTFVSANQDFGQSVVKINGKDGPLLQETDVFSIGFTPGGKHFWYWAKKKDGKETIYVDGQEGPAVDSVWDKHINFSKDGQRYSYFGSIGTGKDRKGVIVLDGKMLQSEFNNMVGVNFSPDGRHVSYCEGNLPGVLDPGTATFRLVVDGVASPWYASAGPNSVDVCDDGRALMEVKLTPEDIPHVILCAKGNFTDTGEGQRPMFSPDGKCIAFLRGNQIIRNDSVLPLIGDYDAVPPQFSPDSRHVYYGSNSRIMIDDQEYSVSEPVYRPFTAKKSRMAFSTGTQVVIDGTTGPLYDWASVPVFDTQENHYAYAARKGSEFRIIVDGKEGKAYRDPIIFLTISPDGHHVAFCTQPKEPQHSRDPESSRPQAVVMVDDRPIARACGSSTMKLLAWSPDSAHIASMTRRDGINCLQVDGVDAYQGAGFVFTMGPGESVCGFDDQGILHAYAIDKSGTVSRVDVTIDPTARPKGQEPTWPKLVESQPTTSRPVSTGNDL